jgi:CheY-like chemotaxis protein
MPTTPEKHPRVPSVLVVDDQADAREMLTEFLSTCGFLVHTTADGVDAISVAARVHPSIILMDLMMPRMDGCEATRRLKADPRTMAIPIIALSAHAHPQLARAAGCDHFFRKPCDLHQLAEEMRKWVDRRA